MDRLGLRIFKLHRLDRRVRIQSGRERITVDDSCRGLLCFPITEKIYIFLKEGLSFVHKYDVS
jgi:hypothetical protein